MMTRRGLLATVLGALAGSQLVKFISEVPVPVKTPIAELFVSVSAEVNDAISGLKPGGVIEGAPLVSIGPLIISSPEEADAFLTRMAKAIALADRRQA